mgnify:CR=1 FL=1
MSEILNDISRTFNEYLLLPNLTDERCIPSNVSLKTPLTKFKKGEEPIKCEHPVRVSNHASCFRRKNGYCTCARRWMFFYLWFTIN